MTKFLLLLFLTVVHLAGGQRLDAATVLKTLSGKVSSIDARENVLGVDFFHPATGEKKELFFRVDGSTGFRGVIALEELRPEDPVSIDYVEESGVQAARLISKVPMSGPPAGLEKFPKL